MQYIINLLDKKENLTNEISRLQRMQQTISEQIKDYVKNLSSEKKRFLDDKILSTFNEEKLKQTKAYRNYMKNLSTGLCTSYQAWNNVFDPYIDKYTIEKVTIDNRGNEGLFVKVTVMPEKPSGYISLTTLYDLYTTDWFNLEEFENCN